MLLQITVFINESKEETEPCTEEGVVVVVAVGGVGDKNTKRNTHAEDERSYLYRCF